MNFENGYAVPESILSITKEALLGDHYMISPMFDFDGRSEEEYGHIWEWDDLTDVIYAEGAYTIRGCVDFEPDCVVLFDDERPVGFYMGGQAWVDPQHRGKSFGAKMVVACMAMTGRIPEVRYLGFSEQGYRTHTKAIEIIRDLDQSASPGI
jgi:hypothetical protein